MTVVHCFVHQNGLSNGEILSKAHMLVVFKEVSHLLAKCFAMCIIRILEILLTFSAGMVLNDYGPSHGAQRHQNGRVRSDFGHD